MPYTPSLWRWTKYTKYGLYALEYLKRHDFQSLADSLKYVAFKKLPHRSRIVTTALGRFRLRSETTDFQFVNFTYEKEIREYLAENTARIGLFIDIGSCIGEYAIWMACRGVKCIAIEPVNHEAIEQNMQLNECCRENIQLLKCAVGKENTSVAFNVLAGVTSSSFINKEEEGNIACRRLDDIIDISGIDQDKVTLIKLDVEGMELEALEGAVNLLRSLRNLQIIYEYTSLSDQVIRKFLDQHAAFTYKDLDNVNTLAVKV